MKKNNSNQITMNSNNNSGKRQAIAESKETPSKMKTLSNPSDVIELGIYAGETLRSFLKNHGKKAFPELLKYYNLSEEIMREYHCHLEPHKERPQAVASDKVSTTASTNVNDNMVASNVTSQVDVETESDDALNTTGLVELDDNKWTSSRSDYENCVLYDPEDDIADTNYYARRMKGYGRALQEDIANL